jgi:predicted ATPase
MLTRLKVSGFKNLIDVEVRFGPFTCIAGPNGIGKSNLFDAIRFLSLLADRPFMEAARAVRGGDDVEALFTRNGSGKMHLECDVLIPDSGRDDFNQPATASYTFLNYQLDIHLERMKQAPYSRMVLDKEELNYIPKGKAGDRLAFPHGRVWRESVVKDSGRRTSIISTEQRAGIAEPVARLRSDRMKAGDKAKRGGGKPSDFSLATLPRTVLSSAQNAEETRTAVLVRQEMRQWRQLQLEPSSLRRPDDLRDPQSIDPSGSHVPATLYRLESSSDDPGVIDAEVANRLAALVDGVRGVRVDLDEGRKLLRLMMTDDSGVELPAGSLSDGTLRFVALAVMESDPTATGVLCLEEPENGIHPQRIEAILSLLADMAVDIQAPVSEVNNPLRQVIATTHSPVVVSLADREDILFARSRTTAVDGRPIRGLELVGMDGTWRSNGNAESVALGTVMAFLGAVRPPEDPDVGDGERKPRRVGNVLRNQLRLPGIPEGEE